MAEIADYKAELEERLTSLTKRLRKAQKLVDTLDDSVQRQILSMYFLEMRRARMDDIASIIGYSTRQEDIYRSAYGHHTETHPRQCVIFGTANNVDGYLKDISGNRRFWPVEISGEGTKKPWDINDSERDQIWAEVMYWYMRKHERSLLLSPEADKIAAEKQTEALESDEREGLVDDFLDKEVPTGWLKMGHEARIAWLDGKIRVLIAHPASVGYGLNLQDGGHIIIWYSLPWSLDQYQQANARLYRQGQQKPVIIHHLIATGTVDEQVMKALTEKNTSQAALMHLLDEKRRE